MKDGVILIQLKKNSFWRNSELFYNIFRSNKVTLKYSTSINDGGLIEVYEGVASTDSTQKATIYLEYAGSFPKMEFTLSRELDSLKNMKLIRTKIVNHQRVLAQHSMVIDEFDSHNYELQATSIEENMEIMKFFILFKELEKNNR